MRLLGCLVAFCLLFAGSARCVEHSTARPNDELAAVKALAKLAIRRTDGARPLGTVGLAPATLAAAPSIDAPARSWTFVAHALSGVSARDAQPAVRARGPPVG